MQQSLLDVTNRVFQEHFKRLCTTNHGVGSQLQIQGGARSDSQKTDKAQSSVTSPNILYVLKNLRLSKQNLKAFVSKRYGKSISDRIMQVLESYNKQMHNIELNSYIDLLNFTFFSTQPHQLASGPLIQVPNIYKLMFSLLDIGSKGFVCDHDLFQIIWALSNDKVTPQQGVDQTNKTKTAFQKQEDPIVLSLNYRDRLPKSKTSVYIESFQEDFNLLNREMQREALSVAKGPNKVLTPKRNQTYS